MCSTISSSAEQRNVRWGDRWVGHRGREDVTTSKRHVLGYCLFLLNTQSMIHNTQPDGIRKGGRSMYIDVEKPAQESMSSFGLATVPHPIRGETLHARTHVRSKRTSQLFCYFHRCSDACCGRLFDAWYSSSTLSGTHARARRAHGVRSVSYAQSNDLEVSQWRLRRAC